MRSILITCIAALVTSAVVGADSSAPPTFTPQQRAYWAFQPLSHPQPPKVINAAWVRNPIDAFVLARLEQAGIAPAPRADKTTLIRRATFDLHGLPPTTSQVDAFLADESPDAYEKLIDRLLESPRYGERMARLWLDLVRYADSDGFKADDYRPLAWRYRDYVVNAYNSDKPYDRFVIEQLAGDELDPDNPEAMIATGYLRLWPYEYNQRDVKKQWDEILTDVTKVTSEAFLGMSIGCAQCHDHKFDPIKQVDHYRFRAFLSSILPDDSLVAATKKQHEEYDAEMAAYDKATSELRERMNKIMTPHRKAVENDAYTKYTDDLKALLDADWQSLPSYEKQIADLARQQLIYEHRNIEKRIKGDEKKTVDALRKQIAEYDTMKPEDLTPVMAVRDVSSEPATVTIPGDRAKRDIKPGFLSILDPREATIERPAKNRQSTGRRLALAKWIASPDNPLSTRVIVNRLWQQHFAVGIVPTANDFGTLGENPTHPQLLDWLATDFVAHGWQFKRLHKLMMLSSAYQQASTVEPSATAASADPQNKLLWRQRVRRLDGEQLRDAMLVAAGQLDTKMGGPGIDESSARRSVYLKQMRNDRPDMIELFDGPDMHNSCARRNVTTTAPQALMLINGDWTLVRARAVAERVQRDHGASVHTMVDAAYRQTLGRQPSDSELNEAIAFLDKPIESDAPDAADLGSDPSLRDVEAIDIDIKRGDRLSVKDNPSFTFDAFTVEAKFVLRSLAPDASVRVIAAQWSGSNSEPGWSFGVTSTKSRYQPRNLILQLIGKSADGKPVHYEVIASDLRPELNRLYHATASVKLSEAGKAGITFTLRDLSGKGGDVQTAQVAHEVVAAIDTDADFTIGNRDASNRQGWDGLIDEVRLYGKALTLDELTKQPREALVGEWLFAGKAAMTDTSGRGNDLVAKGTHAWTAATASKPAPARVNRTAFVDFCHVLLNANEFLYVD